ncbi:hypothetical protein L6R46_07050 [Myxococcota bacterium]|nr:hypothetical protein [Myxococcota bacterium]
MLVPRFVHGLTRDVKKESLRRIRLFQKGATWAEAMADELVDVATLPGLVVLALGHTTVYEPQTHIYSPFHWADDAIWRVRPTLPMSALSSIFFDAVQTPWGVLGMLGDSTGTWMRLEAHHWPYVQAVERHWDEFSALGDRYSGGSQAPRPLWFVSSASSYALCALGLSPEDLQALMPQGFHALYRRLLEVRAAQGLPPPPGDG